MDHRRSGSATKRHRGVVPTSLAAAVALVVSQWSAPTHATALCVLSGAFYAKCEVSGTPSGEKSVITDFDVIAEAGTPAGLYAHDGAEVDFVGGSIAGRGGAYGILAVGPGTAVTTVLDPAGGIGNASVNVKDSGRGVVALDGATVSLAPAAVSAVDGYALSAEGAGSVMRGDGVTVNTFGAGFGAVALNGGQIDLANATLRSTGLATVVAAGADATARLTDSHIGSAAAGGYTVNVQDGGYAELVNIDSYTNTADSYGLRVNGAGSTARLEGSEISTGNTASHAAVVAGGGVLDISRASIIDSLKGTAVVALSDTSVRVADSTVRSSSGPAAVLEGASASFANAQILGKNAAIQLQSASTPNDLTVTGGAIRADNAIYAHSGVSKVHLGDGLAMLVNDSIIAVTGDASVDATLSGITATGNMIADEGGELAIKLIGGTQISAAIVGARGVAVSPDSMWLMSHPSTVDQLVNAGTIEFGESDGTFKTLTVESTYAGEGGTIALNTVLGSDNSATDKLVVHGATSGETHLSIKNAGGAGAYTVADGIQVVQVDGASDGTFALNGRVVAGSYEYLLAQGGKSDPGNGDWYLRSEAPTEPEAPEVPAVPDTPAGTAPPTPIEPVLPERPGVTVIPGVPAEPDIARPGDSGMPSNPHPDAIPVYRPELGAYLSNQRAAATMFNHTLHDRIGQGAFAKASREGEQGGAAWARINRDQFDSVSGSAQVDASTDSDVLQVGGEYTRWTEGDNRFHVGLIGGIGRATADAVSTITGYRAKGQVKGYNLGVYGTWFADAADDAGLYVDSWVQYAQFDNRITSDLLERVSYDAKSWNASIEAGYAFSIRQSEGSQVFVQPQVQVIYNDYRTDSIVEANGTTFAAKTDGFISRLGTRIFGNATTDTNTVQPFAELNWWHSTNAGWVALNEHFVRADAPADVYEAKVGVQLQLGDKWSAWGNVGIRSAAGDYRNVGGQMGLMRRW